MVFGNTLKVAGLGLGFSVVVFLCVIWCLGLRSLSPGAGVGTSGVCVSLGFWSSACAGWFPLRVNLTILMSIWTKVQCVCSVWTLNVREKQTTGTCGWVLLIAHHGHKCLFQLSSSFRVYERDKGIYILSTNASRSGVSCITTPENT